MELKSNKVRFHAFNENEDKSSLNVKKLMEIKFNY